MSQKAPVPGGDLAQLLAALRGAPDAWSRLKLVASGARTLAKLTPQQRVQLLRQLGLQGAEELAEAAAGGDAQTSAAMANALKALESDPQRLRQLAGAIADPNSRRATLMGLGAHVIETVTAPPTKGAPGKAAPVKASSVAFDPAATVTPARSGSGKTQPAAAPSTAQQIKRDLVEAAAALLAGAQPSAPQPPSPAPPGQPAAPQPPSPAPSPSLPPTPHPSPATPPPPAPTPQPTPPSTPVTPPSSPPPTPQPVHPTTPPAPMATAAPAASAASAASAKQATAAAPESAPDPSTIALDVLPSPSSGDITTSLFATPSPGTTLTAIDTTPSPSAHHADVRPAALGTLRDLRRRLADGEALAADELSTLFAQELPQGWARRRALSALFAERRPEALDDALALVAQVGSPVYRRWALADLAASRPWDDGDWDRLVAAAAGAGERRRLALRRRRA